MRSRIRFTEVLLVAGFLVAFTPAALAQVVITTEMTGDALPGAEVTLVATVDIQDGSDLQSIAWVQTYGVEAVVSGADTDTVAVTLGAEVTYKGALIHALTEPLVTQDDLPENVEIPEHGAFGGLQNRFGVTAINPWSSEEAALVVLEITVVTSTGNYTEEAEIHGVLPWQWATGMTNVAVGNGVLLNSKEQTAYDWAFAAMPAGSTAAFDDAAVKHASFTPDLPGTYEVTVTDEATAEMVTMYIYAGNWRGIITGIDADGRPESDSACTGCHSGFAADMFTPWAQSGHAEIFTNNLNTSTHYGDRCFACHTVGYDPNVDNSGVDEAAGYDDFLNAGLINTPSDDNWSTVVADYPDVAQFANIQCENCHGPQSDNDAHGPSEPMGNPRNSLSSDVCAVCHGEPARHARYQQWQLSGHANFELAIDESGSGNCSRCHTANGFLAMLKTMLDDDPNTNPEDNVEVTWTADEAQPQTCQTCHDPHAVGTTSGSDPNATVRISGDTPMLPAGYMATDVGRGAICITCHNTRRDLRNDDTWAEVGSADPARAPHGGAQGDVLMGENAYFVAVGQRSYHSLIEDTCVDCHMEATPPPDILSYNQGGTNHTFSARQDICVECHSVVTFETVAGPIDEAADDLLQLIEDGWFDVVFQVFRAGYTIDYAGEASISNMEEIAEIIFTETHGRQALQFILTDGTELEAHRLNDISAVPPEGDAMDIYLFAPTNLLKSGWNYLLIHADGSHGIHNPAWAMDVLSATIQVIDGGGVGPIDPEETGPGVACLSAFTYWTEIAASSPGAFGTTWRTDVVGQNMGESTATIQFILHTASGNATMDASIDAGVQAVFEDIVGLMGVENDKGALEICSDMPLTFVARIYNQADEGTFGQFMNGLTNLLGLREGDTVKLLGLRQMTDVFRTNISVTNTGMETATVTIALYGTDGTFLTSYVLDVAPGMVVQDNEPFRTRGSSANLGWGYATVAVDVGAGVLTSASVVDSVTGDATTIPMKR